jgi:hypothetical protein
MTDPVDYLEDEIDQARSGGQGWIRLPLEVAVSLRDQIRPLKAWAHPEDVVDDYQAQRHTDAQELIEAKLAAEERRQERRRARIEAALTTVREKSRT